MATLVNKIRKYLDREVDFSTDVRVQDDGDGVPYIKEWNVDEAQPTAEQLNALDSEADTLATNQLVSVTRKFAYGDVGDQLDEIYKDIDAWKTRIKAIKDGNPKS